MSKPGVAHSRAESEAAARARAVASGKIAKKKPSKVRADVLAYLVARDQVFGDASETEVRTLASVLLHGVSPLELQALLVRRMLRLEERAVDAAAKKDHNLELQYERLQHRCLETLRQLVDGDDSGLDVDEIKFTIRRQRRSGTGDQIPIE